LEKRQNASSNLEIHFHSLAGYSRSSSGIRGNVGEPRGKYMVPTIYNIPILSTVYPLQEHPIPSPGTQPRQYHHPISRKKSPRQTTKSQSPMMKPSSRLRKTRMQTIRERRRRPIQRRSGSCARLISSRCLFCGSCIGSTISIEMRLPLRDWMTLRTS
jgi:hypothetical protein